MSKNNAKAEIASVEQQILRLQRTKKAIQKANENFQKMKPEEKRIAIAKDVIAQLKAKRYKARTGQYLTVKPSKNSMPSNNKEQLIGVLCDVDTKCNCCARAAIFASAVSNFNNYKFKEASEYRFESFFADSVYDKQFDFSSEDIEGTERKYFNPKQIEMIETCFEMDEEFSYSLTEQIASAAVAYGKSMGNAEKRMIGIMENIIKNKGEFVIPDKFLKMYEHLDD